MMMMMIHLKGRFELKVVVFFVILHAPLPENIDLLWFAVMNCHMICHIELTSC